MPVQKVINSGGHKTQWAEGAVVIEVAVFDGDGGVAQVPGNLAERDDGPALVGVALVEQDLSGAVVDLARLGQPVGAQVVEAGQLARIRIQESAPGHANGDRRDQPDQEDPSEQRVPPPRAA